MTDLIQWNVPLIQGLDGARPDPLTVPLTGTIFSPRGVSRIDILQEIAGVKTWVSIGTGASTVSTQFPIAGDGTVASPVSLSILTNPTYYVDPVSGSDSNAGTITHPFATINHALQILTPGWYGAATINLRAGTHTLTNFTLIPRGLGNGLTTSGGVLINGVDNTQDPIGNRTASGGTIGSQATFGTVIDSVGGLTVNAFQGKFLRFTSGATLNGLSYLIEQNSSTTFTVEGSFPVAPTTETFVIETPAAILTWPGTQTFMGFGAPMGLMNVILNGAGGSNFVTFNEMVVGIQKTQMNNFGSFGITLGEHSSIVNLTAIAPQLGSPTIPNQCGGLFNFNGPISPLSTTRISLTKCLFKDAHLTLLQGSQFQALDSTFIGNAYIRSLWGAFVSLDRFHFIAVNASPGATNTIGGLGAAIVLSKGAAGSILHGDISNTPATFGAGDAILVEDRSVLQISNMTGTGNAGFGVRVSRFSEVIEDKNAATLTLTGTLGDVSVGAVGASAWPVTAAVTDPVQLCVVIGT